MGVTIEKITTRTLAIPYDEPIKHPYLGARTRACVLLVEIHASDGSVGFGFHGIESLQLIHGIEQVIEYLSPLLKGLDPSRREFVYDRMWNLTVDILHSGVSAIALAILDIALWDLYGKQAGQPLWKILGGFRDKVPAYAAHSLWRHFDTARLEAEGAKLVEQGFRAMKLRSGGRPMADDIDRARRLRAAVGPDVVLMTDALWYFRPAEAVRLGDALAELDFYWLEEPVKEGDLDGLAQVRNKVRVPIAAGERLSNPADLPALLPGIDHCIIDVHHIGGITPWLRAAMALNTRSIPLSGHASHEINAPLIAAIPNGSYVEYMPRREMLFKNPHQVVDGHIHLTDMPGLGLELDEAALQKYAA